MTEYERMLRQEWKDRREIRRLQLQLEAYRESEHGLRMIAVAIACLIALWIAIGIDKIDAGSIRIHAGAEATVEVGGKD